MVKNWVDLVLLCENALGWAPENDDTPMWKVRTAQAGRLKKKAATNPALYTLANLELAVAYLQKKRQPIKSPIYLFYVVDEALQASYQNIDTPVETLIMDALRYESDLNDDESGQWINRLNRAFGTAREAVYLEWRDARGAA